MSGTVYCTMWGFPSDVHIVDRRQLGIRRTLTTLLRLVRPGDAVLLNGALGFSDGYVDQLLGLVLRRLRPGTPLVFADATWHPRSRPGETRRPWMAHLTQAWNKILLRLLDGPRTHYCFLSRQECDDLVAEAGVDAPRVHFTPFSTTIWGDERLEQLERIAAEPGDYVFSGGNSSRDYHLLTQAVEGLGRPVRVATSRHLGPVPGNVQGGAVSPEEFLELMAGSRAVALPLSADTRRSVGQQTFLNALLLGKPVVVTDAPGVRDYLTDGVDALVVAPEPAAMRSALRWVMDPDNADEVRAMTDRGRQLARKLNPERYQRSLIEIAQEAAAQRLGAECRARSSRPVARWPVC